MIATACPCGGIRRNGVCDRCGPRKGRTKEQRPHNNRTWYAFSRRFLANHPLCEDCETKGRIAPATQTHHKVKLSDDPSQMYNPDNCMALCQSCHSVRTARGE